MVGRIVKRCKLVQLRFSTQFRGRAVSESEGLESIEIVRISIEFFNLTEAKWSRERFYESGGLTVQSRGIVFARLRLISIG